MHHNGSSTSLFLLAVVDRQHIRAVIILNTALVRKAREDVASLLKVNLKALPRAAGTRSISAVRQSLGRAVDEGTVVLSICEAVASCAVETLDGNVAQEGKGVGALPLATVVDAVEGEGVVDVVGTAELTAVEETHGHEHHGRQLAVGEADEEVLIAVALVVVHELVSGGVQPRETDVAGELSTVTGVVVVANVLGVLPA